MYNTKCSIHSVCTHCTYNKLVLVYDLLHGDFGSNEIIIVIKKV